MNIANDQVKANSLHNQDVEIVLVNDSVNKKEFSVTAKSATILEAVDAEIAERAKTFKIAGFSKGKGAPVSLVKRQIGKAVMTEHIDKLIGKIILDLIKTHNLNVTSTPTIDVQEFNPEGELKISVSFSVMAEMPKIDFSNDKFKIETLELIITDEDISQAKDAIVKMITSYKEAPEGHKSESGDAIIIDFHGKLNGEEFEGNKASQIRIEIGEGSFIKDFEEKLVGLSKEDEKTITVRFPEDYNEVTLAGKDVEFDVKVHEVLVKEGNMNVEEELKQRFEVKSVEAVNEVIKSKILSDFSSISRVLAKKKLFDAIDSEFEFDLPEEMVEQDFQGMWRDVSAKIAAGQINKTEEEAKAELKSVAKRRVKLGLILADVAKRNEIAITESDLEDAKNNEKLRRPDNAQEIEEFFSKKENRDVVQGSILEEKVVDFIMTQTQKNSVAVTTSEFNEKYAQQVQDLIQG